jgi:hypothetical protein
MNQMVSPVRIISLQLITKQNMQLECSTAKENSSKVDQEFPVLN